MTCALFQTRQEGRWQAGSASHGSREVRRASAPASLVNTPLKVFIPKPLAAVFEEVCR